MNGETTDWTHLREFSNVDLSRSFVLSWDFVADALQIDVDLFICRDHPLYESPRPAEKACFRAAHIVFPHCAGITSKTGTTNAPVAGLVPSLGGGQISGLIRTGEGQYELAGEFGVIAIQAERPMVRLKDRTI